MAATSNWNELVTWYIGSTNTNSPKAPVSQGSAVAVRLSKVGSNAPARNFLLTCDHVIRQVVPGQQRGTLYSEIRAWHADSGYNPAMGYRVSPFAAVMPLDNGNPTKFFMQPVPNVPNADWALLEFSDINKANDQNLPTALSWFDGLPPRGTECQIVGYPGGAAGFGEHNIVRPSLPYGIQVVIGAEDGLIKFQGDHGRPGMSGGGVFLANSQTLVGLHRDRHDAVLQLGAVAASQIKSVLNQCGYEIASGKEITDTSTFSHFVARVLIDVQPDTFSHAEWQIIAAAILKVPEAECKRGLEIQVSLGPSKRLTIEMSEFSADGGQRMAIKNDVRLLQVQNAGKCQLERVRDDRSQPAMPVEFLIEEALEKIGRTVISICDHVTLMTSAIYIEAYKQQ